MEQFIIEDMVRDDEMDAKGYVHWKTWHETYEGLIDEKYLKKVTLEKCVRMAHRFPDNTLLLKDDGCVIGFVCCGSEQEGKGEIFALYLLKEYHGRKLGYALMNAAIQKLSHCEKIELWVLKGNDQAIRFYERYGFKLEGTQKEILTGVELKMIFENTGR